MDLLAKLKYKDLTSILDQFAKLEKLEEIALKLEFVEIMINYKTCFWITKVNFH